MWMIDAFKDKIAWKKTLMTPSIWIIAALLVAMFITSSLCGSGAPCFQKCADIQEKAIGLCVDEYNKDRTTRLSDCIRFAKENYRQCITLCSKGG